MNIGAISYTISAFTFFIFLVVLLTDKHKGNTKRSLVFAAAMSCIWSFHLAYISLTNSYNSQFLFFEFLKDISWLLLLLQMLAKAYGDRLKSNQIKLIKYGLSLFVFILLSPILVDGLFTDVPFLSDIQYLPALSLFFTISGIVLVEHVYRSTRSEQKWAIKYLCLGLLGMFIYDFYMYSDALLYNRIDPVLWNSRGFIFALTVPIIGVSISRDPLWSPEIFISRRVVFHTTTLLASGIYLMVMGIAGYYVRDYGGSWGLVAQAIFLFITIVILALFVSSRRIRAKLYVLVNKHFYPYKYDYRDEWLRFIRTISQSSVESELYHNTIKSIAQIIGSPGGMLWLREDGSFVCADTWQMEHVSDHEPSGTPLPVFLEENEFVISVDEFIKHPEVYNRLGYLELPDWLKNIDPWLIVPLVYNDMLIGFIVLEHATARKNTFNWEDSDLLKTAARQVASYLEQMNASKALAEAKQFESFNKVSTYVIHDIKNLTAQLSLISSNAEKHKDNPLFMEDVFKTINNSVNKMNKMLEVVSNKAKHQSNTTKVDIISILKELIHQRQITGAKPVPTLRCETNSYYLEANHDQLVAILGHLVQNAQDATEDDGNITIAQLSSSEGLVVKIEDTGCGMSKKFIQNNLFKPFKTTKGSKGMGVGVYEAREIIKAIGGRIEVKSELDVGTCFTLVFFA